MLAIVLLIGDKELVDTFIQKYTCEKEGCYEIICPEYKTLNDRFGVQPYRILCTTDPEIDYKIVMNLDTNAEHMDYTDNIITVPINMDIGSIFGNLAMILYL